MVRWCRLNLASALFLAYRGRYRSKSRIPPGGVCGFIFPDICPSQREMFLLGTSLWWRFLGDLPRDCKRVLLMMVFRHDLPKNAFRNCTIRGGYPPPASRIVPKSEFFAKKGQPACTTPASTPKNPSEQISEGLVSYFPVLTFTVSLQSE